EITGESLAHRLEVIRAPPEELRQDELAAWADGGLIRQYPVRRGIPSPHATAGTAGAGSHCPQVAAVAYRRRAGGIDEHISHWPTVDFHQLGEDRRAHRGRRGAANPDLSGLVVLDSGE